MCYMRVMWAQSLSRYPFLEVSTWVRFTSCAMQATPIASSKASIAASLITNSSSQRVSCSFHAKSCSYSLVPTAAIAMT
jgi:hypothetical protein